MEKKTHPAISETLVGTVREIGEGTAAAWLRATPEMAADDRGLVHGGFTFGLADYAAMLAVNDPNVVLGAASVKFLAPVRVGVLMTAEARVLSELGKKRTVVVEVSTDKKVMDGEFTCFVLQKHVLD